MLDLKSVTLVCADDSINSYETYQIFSNIANNINFGSTLFASTKIMQRTVEKRISNIKDYNLFVVKELNNYINTDYVLIMQGDGYPINISAWKNEYLAYDYIGAPWYNQPWPIDKTVGNGGFSLRSKRFLEESSKLPYDGNLPEDVFLCREVDSEIKSKGLRFANHDMAYTFSVEDMPYKGQFGFHGKGTIAINRRFGVFK
jgi:hypothetical protein